MALLCHPHRLEDNLNALAFLPRHCHTLTVSAKILRIFGRGDCKEAVSRGKNRPAPTAHVAGLD